MRRLASFFVLLALLASPALAQNLPSGSTRVQGTPDGYGAPVQVTIVGPDGSDVSSTPVSGAVTATGNVANDAPDSGAPIKEGGRACAAGGLAVDVAVNDRVDACYSISGSAIVQIGTGDDYVPITTLADNRSALVSLPVAAFPQVYDGATWDMLRGDTNGLLMQGNVAHDAPDAGSPLGLGALATDTPSGLTPVTNNDRVRLTANGFGQLYVAAGDWGGGSGSDDRSLYGFSGRTGAGTVPNPVAVGGFVYNGSTFDRQRGDTGGITVQSGLGSTHWSYAAASGGIDNTTTAVTLRAAPGANVCVMLKTITLAHDTLGASTEIAVRDEAGGTVKWRGKLQTAAQEDEEITFDPPLKGTANTLMEFVTLTAVTGDVLVNAQGYTVPC